MANQSRSQEIQPALVFWRVSKIGIPAFFILLLLGKFLFQVPFSNWVFFIPIFLYLTTYLNTRLASELFFEIFLVLDMFLLAVMFYFLSPWIANYLGSIGWFCFVFYVFFIANAFGIFAERRIAYIFLLIACICSAVLIFFEYFGIYPKGSIFPVQDYFLLNKPHLISSLLINIGAYIFFALYFNSFWGLLRGEIGKVEGLKETLEQKVKQRTEELEEARSILEIKIKARTRELEELNQSLESKIEQRTKELQQRVNELEKIQQLTVDRELKMVELKKEKEKLEKELAEIKSRNNINNNQEI